MVLSIGTKSGNLAACQKAGATLDHKCSRVLYLTDLVPSGKFGSMEEQIFTIARAFREHGGLFLPVFGGELAPDVVNQYRQARLPVEGLNLHPLVIDHLVRLRRLVRQNDITAIHWNFYSPINPYVWLLTLLAPRLRHYITDHTSRELPLGDPPSGLKKLAKTLLFKRYAKVWCISNFVVDCLEHSGTWSNIERCTYFINTNRFRPDPVVRAEIRKRLDAEKKFVVLFVANIIRVKGGDVVIKALSNLPDSVQLWIVGDGADLPRLKSLTDELLLGARVHFMGNQNHVEPYMQAADCFACPSLWGEATGLVNLEAQAVGLPVIASDIGGIPEFVHDERTGLLFPPGDNQRLAQQIRRLLEDPELCDRLSKTARQTAVDQFSIERRLEDYVRAYQ